ncbi:MAG TPA: maleylacetoacetate isomerase [Solimonas sp.]|nr:maleylacetoacetate isomerase [Solimonas sp.]
MKLYQHLRSSASYRVRIALALKGLEYDSAIVDLLRGDQRSAGYARRNPAQLVPLLEDGEARIAQSMAIIEYLDELHPEPPLLPRGKAADRAWVRQLALAVACEIHPLNNLRVIQHLGAAGFSEAQRSNWARHWIAQGFAALETELSASPRSGACCYGDQPTLADICLIPQMLNATRVELDLEPYPTLRRIEQHCMGLDAFARTHPAQLSAGPS